MTVPFPTYTSPTLANQLARPLELPDLNDRGWRVRYYLDRYADRLAEVARVATRYAMDKADVAALARSIGDWRPYLFERNLESLARWALASRHEGLRAGAAFRRSGRTRQRAAPLRLVRIRTCLSGL